VSELLPVREPVACPERIEATSAMATWVPENGHWAVTVFQHYPDPDTDRQSHIVYNGAFGSAECPTAYSAMMLGLSEWRASH